MAELRGIVKNQGLHKGGNAELKRGWWQGVGLQTPEVTTKRAVVIAFVWSILSYCSGCMAVDTFNAAGANRALELIGKHAGMFVDRFEHTGKEGGPIATSNVTPEGIVRDIDDLFATPALRPEKRKEVTH